MEMFFNFYYVSFVWIGWKSSTDPRNFRPSLPDFSGIANCACLIQRFSMLSGLPQSPFTLKKIWKLKMWIKIIFQTKFPAFFNRKKWCRNRCRHRQVWRKSMLTCTLTVSLTNIILNFINFVQILQSIMFLDGMQEYNSLLHIINH